MRRWRLLHTGHADGATNMAVDEAILTMLAAGESPPTIRFYGWEPTTVSIGYFQDMEREVDLAACAGLGLGFIRRPTGGRAVLHDVEVTYSIVVSEQEPHIPPGITESYRVLSEGILTGLRSLGVAAEMVQVAERGGATEPASPACFDAPSWYEVAVNGKKMVGSAQTRKMGVVLQHGSILLDLDIEKLFAVLRFPSAKHRERAKARFVEKATSLRGELGNPLSFMETAAAVAKGFERAMGIVLEPGSLTERECEVAEQLRLAKYATDEWNLGRPSAQPTVRELGTAPAAVRDNAARGV